MTQPPQEPGSDAGDGFGRTLIRVIARASLPDILFFIPWILAAVGSVFHLFGKLYGIPWMITLSGWLMLPLSCCVLFLVLVMLPLSLLARCFEGWGDPPPPPAG